MGAEAGVNIGRSSEAHCTMIGGTTAPNLPVKDTSFTMNSPLVVVTHHKYAAIGSKPLESGSDDQRGMLRDCTYDKQPVTSVTVLEAPVIVYAAVKLERPQGTTCVVKPNGKTPGLYSIDSATMA